jgi:hypothetical protein
MPSFAEIFYMPGSQNSPARVDALHREARNAGWMVLGPGDTTDLGDETHSIVISGVTWSRADLVVLDELAARDTRNVRVWFFNPDVVFPDERILPGAGRMVQTPALAEYLGQHLVRFLQGGAVSGGVIERIRELFPNMNS